uniref:Uncharacterized protein n=1 Tax=Anguilla anguilla TaxID=7936 RepID=A0A0E9X1Z4_ANGAN
MCAVIQHKILIISKIIRSVTFLFCCFLSYNRHHCCYVNTKLDSTNRSFSSSPQSFVYKILVNS